MAHPRMSLNCALALLQMKVPDKEIACQRFEEMASVVHPDKAGGHQTAHVFMKEARDVVWAQAGEVDWAPRRPAQQSVPLAAQQFAAWYVPQPAPPLAQPAEGFGWPSGPSDGRGSPAAASRGEGGDREDPSMIAPHRMVTMSWWLAVHLPDCLPDHDGGSWQPMMDGFVGEFTDQERKLMSRQGMFDVHLSEIPAHITQSSPARFLITRFANNDGSVTEYCDPSNAIYAAIFDKAYENAVYSTEQKADLLKAVLGAADLLLEPAGTSFNWAIGFSGLNDLRAALCWVDRQVRESIWSFPGGGSAPPEPPPDPYLVRRLLELVRQDGNGFIIDDRTCPHCGRTAFGKSTYNSQDAVELAVFSHLDVCY
jgi:hypothetical protein